MVAVCAIMGGTTYVNNWLSINLLVVLVSMLIGGAVFAFSRILPKATGAKVTSAVRSELTQAFLSAIIVFVLLGMASTACNISASMSQAVTGTSLSPFQYADYYIGNLSTNSGIGLLSHVYLLSMQFSIESTILDASYGQLLNALIPATGFSYGIFSVSFGAKVPLGKSFKLLSSLFLTVFSLLLIIVIGALYVQWLLLPLLQYTAFIVVLPVALVMRSMSFVGGNLRNTANAFLAIAMCAYLVYPLMVGFDSYAMNWIFSPSNPSYQYLSTATSTPHYSTSTFFSQMPSSSLISGNPATSTSFLDSYLTSASINVNPLFELGDIVISALTVPTTVITITEQMAKFLFVGIFMFAINIAVTAGLAMGITKGLNSGVEGASNFWGSL
ncbi:MAG: hypothetical protein ACP5TL_00645 [Candidatus Micrarchaeia archaeon]